jgi:Secretion system C-terminal sorting domain/Domain of unknown function (DUF4397)
MVKSVHLSNEVGNLTVTSSTWVLMVSLFFVVRMALRNVGLTVRSHRAFQSLIVIAGLFLSTANTGFSQNSARIQFANIAAASAWDTVDIYAGSTLLVNDLAFEKATNFLTVTLPFVNRLTITPGNLMKVLAQVDVSLSANRNYAITLYEKGTTAAPELAAHVDETALTAPVASNAAEVRFVHLSPRVPALDMVMRDPMFMFVSGLRFENQTLYVSLNPVEYYFEVKEAGTTNILSTNRLSLQAYRGSVVRVLTYGNATTPRDLKMLAILANGSTFTVDYAPVARVQYINTLVDTVDIYKNNSLFADNARYGSAMPYKNVPALTDIRVAVSNWRNANPLSTPPFGTFPIVFENGKTYMAVSGGERSNASAPLNMFFCNYARETTRDANMAGVLFFNGAFNAGTLNVVPTASTTAWFQNVAYGRFSEFYQEMQPINHRLRLMSGSSTLLEFSLNLDSLRGRTITLYATQRPDGNRSGLDIWAAMPNGTTARLAGTTAENTVLPESGVAVYPNPAQAILNMDITLKSAAIVSCQIINVLGQLINLQNLGQQSAGRQIYNIDVTDLVTGTYYIRINAGHDVVTKPFIVSESYR